MDVNRSDYLWIKKDVIESEILQTAPTGGMTQYVPKLFAAFDEAALLEAAWQDPSDLAHLFWEKGVLSAGPAAQAISDCLGDAPVGGGGLAGRIAKTGLKALVNQVPYATYVLKLVKLGLVFVEIPIVARGLLVNTSDASLQFHLGNRQFETTTHFTNADSVTGPLSVEIPSAQQIRDPLTGNLEECYAAQILQVDNRRDLWGVSSTYMASGVDGTTVGLSFFIHKKQYSAAIIDNSNSANASDFYKAWVDKAPWSSKTDAGYATIGDFTPDKKAANVYFAMVYTGPRPSPPSVADIEKELLERQRMTDHPILPLSDPANWAQSLPYKNWPNPYLVRYRVTFVFQGGKESEPGPWWLPREKGLNHSEGFYGNKGYCVPYFKGIPIGPENVVQRKIYRQFKDEEIELVTIVDNNTATHAFDCANSDTIVTPGANS